MARDPGFLLEAMMTACPGCGKPIEVEYERTTQPQPPGFEYCPYCDLAVAGNERRSFIKITVSPDLPKIEQSEHPFWRRRNRR